MRTIWGFDIGTTSVGFAIITLDEEKETGAIRHEGVRIFPEGVTEDKQEPRNWARRLARMRRRQLRRHNLRHKLLQRAFTEVGLLPPFRTPAWDDLMALDPYELRTRGLRDKLEPHHFGRALYHLAQLRGFISARITDEKDKEKKKEEGKVKKAIAGLQKELAGRTLGEFLASLSPDERKRNRYLSREMIEDEFDRLWDTQAKHHADLLTDELKEKLHDIIFYQRPIFWRLKTLGTCELEPGEPGCPLASWRGQRFRLLQMLNNLRLSKPVQRELNPNERAQLLARLESEESLSWSAVRKQLGLSKEYKFNLEEGEEPQLLGNAVEAALWTVFDKDWETHPARDRLRSEIHFRLAPLSQRRLGNKKIELLRKEEIAPQKQEFIRAAQTDYGLTPEQATKLADLDLPDGWLRFSEKAIAKLLPYLEAGLTTDKAQDKAYPGWRDSAGELLDRLPSRTLSRAASQALGPNAAPRALPDLRNPTVMRALHELRKVVNNLLRVYGKPDLIRIELARQLRYSRADRARLQKEMRQQETRRREAAQELSNNRLDPTDEAIQKWLLWKECNETCPYTGHKISFDALFREGEFQIEHIYPRSRSLDNRFANKTLCETNLNRDKGDRTPYEYFRHDPQKWHEVKTRVRSLLPPAKAEPFLREDYPEAGKEDLEARQLADTGYIGVEARKLLQRLGVKVEPTNGQVTAQLRTRWGLNRILDPEGGDYKKNRQDHRHHAVDALAVALTAPAYVKRLSDYYARARRGEKPSLPQPWETFWQDAKQKTQVIVVSHRVRRKLSGPLHAQTFYGDTGQEITEGGITYRRFVVRKPLEEITAEQVENIRDPVIKALVQEHIENSGVDPKKPSKAFPPFPCLVIKETGEAREIRKVRIVVKQQLDLMVPLRPEPKTYADTGDNHHMAIYQLPDGTVHFETVSLFEAIRRLRASEPIVRRTSEKGGRFLMSLAPGDTLEFPGENGQKHYRIVTSVWAAGPIVLKEHIEAGDVVWKRPNPPSLIKMGARKVKVDPIGRVRPAND